MDMVLFGSVSGGGGAIELESSCDGYEDCAWYWCSVHCPVSNSGFGRKEIPGMDRRKEKS